MFIPFRNSLILSVRQCFNSILMVLLAAHIVARMPVEFKNYSGISKFLKCKTKLVKLFTQKNVGIKSLIIIEKIMNLFKIYY